MKRATILSNHSSRPAGSARSAHTYVKLGVFFALWLILFDSWIPEGDLLWRLPAIVVSAALSYLTVLLWDRWRGWRELQVLAYEDWIERTKAIAAQYDLFVTNHTEDEWRELFEAGLNPNEAVTQYRSCQPGFGVPGERDPQ